MKRHGAFGYFFTFLGSVGKVAMSHRPENALILSEVCHC